MISNNNPYTQIICDGTNSTFDLGSIEYLEDADNLQVTHYDFTLKESSILDPSHYTIDVAADTITLDTVYPGDGTKANSDLITITLDMVFDQEVDITSNSSYHPEVLERMYDKNTLLAKQVKDTSSRAVRLDATDVGEELVLPPIDELKNGTLGFDADGNPIARAGWTPDNYDENYTYQAGAITQHDGHLWICISTSTGEEPTDSATNWERYVARVNEWQTNITYPVGSGVFYNGDIYLCLTENKGSAPTGAVGDNWKKLNSTSIYWDSNTIYAKDEITAYSDATLGKYGILVKSRQPSNYGNPPDLTPGATDAWWEVVKTGGSVEVEGTVANATSANTLMYFGSDGKLYTGDNRDVSKSFLAGFLTVTTTSANETQSVLSGGLLTGFSGLTVGTDYYLGNSGNVITRGEIEYNEYIVSVGRAVATDTIDVSIRNPEPTRNQDNGLSIGAIIEFATYKDRSAEGLLPFDFDNAISQANYPILFAEIGHKWNDAHVAVGDTDLSGSSTLFYPTPPPSYYARVGIPDSSSIDGTTAIDTANDTITLSSADYSRFKHFKYNSDSYNGVPVYLSGTAPTGLDTDTVYYIRFTDDVNYYITLHPTEADAVSNTNVVDLTVADGSFTLTQEGIVLEDTFQRHWHDYPIYGSSTGSGTDQYTAYRANANNSGWEAKSPISDGANGGPRVSNETRPKTMMMFKYVKAEYVTTAGEPVSALRYQWERGTSTTWQSQDILVTHNLNAELKDLIIEVEVSKDGTTGTNGIFQNIKSIAFDRASGSDGNYGIILQPNDNNSFYIRTPLRGIMYLRYDNNEVGALIDGDSGNVRATITKPNLVSTIFDTVEMPRKYDISAENKTVTLPLLTGVNQKRTYKWTGGDGTYKLQFSVPDNSGTYSTSEYEGEGEGVITFEATNTDSGLAWEVTKYEDSGEWNNNWRKDIDGTLKQWGIDTLSVSASATGSKSVILDIPLYDYTGAVASATLKANVNGSVWMTYIARATASDTGSFSFADWEAGTKTDSVNFGWTIVERWKA